MATKRDHPYSQFNFHVSWDGLGEKTVEAGFQEVSGLGLEMTIAEYRAGNHSENSSLKVNGTNKVPDVTLKRGLIGSKDLFDWINETRTEGYKAKPTVTIHLMDESRNGPVATWKLQGVAPLKYTGPTLAGKGGGDVAMEELVLSCEGYMVE